MINKIQGKRTHGTQMESLNRSLLINMKCGHHFALSGYKQTANELKHAKSLVRSIKFQSEAAQEYLPQAAVIKAFISNRNDLGNCS